MQPRPYGFYDFGENFAAMRRPGPRTGRVSQVLQEQRHQRDFPFVFLAGARQNVEYYSHHDSEPCITDILCA